MDFGRLEFCLKQEFEQEAMMLNNVVIMNPQLLVGKLKFPIVIKRNQY